MKHIITLLAYLLAALLVFVGNSHAGLRTGPGSGTTPTARSTTPTPTNPQGPTSPPTGGGSPTSPCPTYPEQPCER